MEVQRTRLRNQMAGQRRNEHRNKNNNKWQLFAFGVGQIALQWGRNGAQQATSPIEWDQI